MLGVSRQEKRISGAYVLLNCKKGGEEKIAETLKRIREVREVQCIEGPYNLIIKLESDSRDVLQEIITWRIRRLDDVKATYTLGYDEDAAACEGF